MKHFLIDALKKISKDFLLEAQQNGYKYVQLWGAGKITIDEALQFKNEEL